MSDAAAIISDDGLYRYRLTRWFGPGQTATWIMLNPSTADATTDDPTIRKVVGFSKQWGFGQVNVVNLFAYRATNPKEIAKVDDPVGPENDEYLAKALEAFFVVGAWGASGDYARRYFRRQKVQELSARRIRPVRCLGVTKSGDPRHPLYVAYSTLLQPWPEVSV